jgi:hypothetical protein
MDPENANAEQAERTEKRWESVEHNRAEACRTRFRRFALSRLVDRGRASVRSDFRERSLQPIRA